MAGGGATAQIRITHELQRAGLGGLYRNLRDRGELNAWAQRLGVVRHRAV